MFNLILSPLTKLLSGSVPESITSLPSQAVDLVSAIPARMADVVSFSPADWLLDTLIDWRDAALGWLASAGQLGLLGVAGVIAFRLGGIIYRRTRQDATWLRWRVPQQIGLAAVAEFGDRRCCYSDGVLLVNAWASGQVARWLQAHGYSQEVGR
jgi:hypothetical protein